MKILLYGINFAPELTGIGKYTAEMAQWLADQGHTVRVVTAPPYYPQWRVFDGHVAGRYRRETWKGVELIRCPLWVPRRPTGATRLLHLLSFAASSLPAMLQQIVWRPNLVWVVEPPLFCASAALLLGALVRAPTVLHVQDLEVDAAFELGLLRGRRRRMFVETVERWLLRRFDVVSSISQRMLQRLEAKGVGRSRMHYMPNWVDLKEISEGQGAAFRASLELSAGATVALYSGNMGKKQGLELLAQVAQALIGQPTIQFVFCGNGVGRQELEDQCAGLHNVRFLDLQPQERLPDLLAIADVHLLPQRADAADLVMPSKLTGMLASGRPVVATAAPSSELAEVVQQCGLVVAPGDWRGVANAILLLATNSQLATTLGGRGREYAQRYLNRDAILRHFLDTAGRAGQGSRL